MNKILIMDSDFPQVGYEVTEEELIEILEKEDRPIWWKNFYKQKLLDRWNEKDINSN